MIGVGKKTLKNLQFLKIKTIGDLANYPDHSILEAILGKNTTAYLLDHAYGNGDTVVDVNRSSEFSSMSNSQTSTRGVILKKYSINFLENASYSS